MPEPKLHDDAIETDTETPGTDSPLDEIFQGIADNLDIMREELTAAQVFVTSGRAIAEDNKKPLRGTEIVRAALDVLVPTFKERFTQLRQLHEEVKRRERLRSANAPSNGNDS